MPERKTINELAFDHYLRTGERLTSKEWSARYERKFNPYHDEVGRFTSPPGVTVSYGAQRTRSADQSPTVVRPTSRQAADLGAGRSSTPKPTKRPAPPREAPTGNSRAIAAVRSGTRQANDEHSQRRSIPRPESTRSNNSGEMTSDRLRTFDLLGIRNPPHLDLSAGDTAVSFGLRQIGAGTYQQVDPNPHARGRISDQIQGRGTLRCNAFVYDALNWAGAAPARMQGGRIPVASEWGSSQAKIGYYPVVGAFTVPRTGVNSSILGRIKEGDVISDGSHVGLVTLRSGSPQTVSAVPAWHPGQDRNPNLPVLGGVIQNDWGFRAGQRVVVRRFDVKAHTR